MLGTRCLAGLALLAGPLACGDSSAPPGTDGGADQALPPDLALIDRWSPDWAGACDPTDQNCPMGEECTLMCPQRQFACTASTNGTATHGADCMVGSCLKGMVCIRISPDNNIAKCRKFCRLDSDCPMGKTCTLMGVICSGSTQSSGWLCSL